MNLRLPDRDEYPFISWPIADRPREIYSTYEDCMPKVEKTVADYSPPGRGCGPITEADIRRLRTAWIDRHKGDIDDSMLVAVMTQYIDLLIDASRRDIERGSGTPDNQ